MSDFNETEFTIKANLMIKNILNSYTLNQIDTVAHFMSHELYSKLKQQLEDNQNRGVQVFFDEVNVNSKVSSTKEDSDYSYVFVECFCKYLYYEKSLKDGKILLGDLSRRRELVKKVLFQKRKDASSYGDVIRCLGCGTSLNINENGVCPNCGRIFDLDQYDFIIKEMDL